MKPKERGEIRLAKGKEVVKKSAMVGMEERENKDGWYALVGGGGVRRTGGLYKKHKKKNQKKFKKPGGAGEREYQRETRGLGQNGRFKKDEKEGGQKRRGH